MKNLGRITLVVISLIVLSVVSHAAIRGGVGATKLEGLLGNYVLKAGDTMTGTLTLGADAKIFAESYIDTSGNIWSIKATPGSASTAVIVALEAASTNWDTGGTVLKLSSYDAQAALIKGYSDTTEKFTVTRAGGVTISDNLKLTGGGSIVTTTNGDLTLAPDGTGDIVISNNQIVSESHTDTSGNIWSIKATPASESTATLLRIEAAGTNWGIGSRSLELISEDDSCYPLIINNGLSATAAIGRAGNAFFFGGIDLKTSGSIITEDNTDLTFIPSGAGITIVGDAGSTGQGLNTNDDLLVTGKLEIDGDSYFDADAYINGDWIRIADDTQLQLGDSQDFRMEWNTDNESPNTFKMGVSAADRNIVICEGTDLGVSFNHAQQTNPTLWIQSSDGTTITDWLSLSHDQTDARIQTGAGNLSIGSQSDTKGLGNNGDLFVSGNMETGGTAYLDTLEVMSEGYFPEDTPLLFATSDDPALLTYDTNQTVNSFMLFTSPVSNSLIIAPLDGYEEDYGHAQQADPTLFIQSGDLVNFDAMLSLSHDQTDGLIQTGDGGIKLLAADGFIVQIGDAGSQGHFGENTDSALYVSGWLEVDGESYFDDLTTHTNNLLITDNNNLQFGTDADFIMQYDTNQTNDALMIGTSIDSETIIITQKADVNVDFGHAQQTNPTVFIQSADETTTDDYLSLSHDQTNVRILSGSGNISFGLGNDSNTLTATDDVYVTGKLEVDGIVYADSDLKLIGDMTLVAGGQINSTSNSNVVLIPHGTGITQIGDAGSPGNLGTPTNDDLFVSGRIEVDGISYFDGLLTANSSIKLAAQKAIYQSSATGAIIPGDTWQTNNALSIQPAVASGNALLIYTFENQGTDFAHPQQTNPTLFIQSASTEGDMHISFVHDQTDARIKSGSGNVSIGSGNDTHSLNSVNDLFVSGDLEVDGMAYFDTGSIYLSETSTPSPVADFGAVYTQSDNELYFQDGAGVEHTVVVTDKNYGEMYWNNNGNPTVIETANTPIMVRETTTGLVNGWTYNAGSTGLISQFADGTGKVNVNCEEHLLETGDEVSIRGTTNYNGIWTITNIDQDWFSIPDTWVANDGEADWDEGSYLEAGTGTAGKYATSYSISGTEAGGGGSDWISQLYVNSTGCPKCIGKRKMVTNDYGNLIGHSIMTIADGDRIYLTVKSTGTNNLTVQYGNLDLHRL